jgi:hypothetical protein
MRFEDGKGIKNDRFSRYMVLLNFLTNNGTSQYYNYHRARNTFVANVLKGSRHTSLGSTSESQPLVSTVEDHDLADSSEIDDHDDYEVEQPMDDDVHEHEHVHAAVRASAYVPTPDSSVSLNVHDEDHVHTDDGMHV